MYRNMYDLEPFVSETSQYIIPFIKKTYKKERGRGDELLTCWNRRQRKNGIIHIQLPGKGLFW